MESCNLDYFKYSNFLDIIDGLKSTKARQLLYSAEWSAYRSWANRHNKSDIKYRFYGDEIAIALAEVIVNKESND